MDRTKKQEFLKDFLMMNAGTLLLTVGVYFFKVPNGFAPGGVSGLSITLSRALRDVAPWFTQARIMSIINVLLLVIGLIVLGKNCGGRTIFCSLLFSFENQLFEWFVPLDSPLTNQPFMELTYAILLTGIGSAILFNCSASSGGTDIVALILKKYTKMNVGRALLVSDFLIAATTFFVIGVEAGLYSVLGLFAKAFLIDSLIESINLCKSFTIITTKPDEIEDYIMNTLHRGVTAYDATGTYTHESRKVLITVCRRSDAVKLKAVVKDLDPQSFVIVTNTSEIIGKGFRGV